MAILSQLVESNLIRLVIFLGWNSPSALQTHHVQLMLLVFRPATIDLMRLNARLYPELVLFLKRALCTWGETHLVLNNFVALFFFFLQIRCGDLFENSVVDEFNECAVSRKKCVPRKSDVGEFPVPDPNTTVGNFNIKDFSGTWFITSGLNPTFDTFDCQRHEFHVESDRLVGNLSWRIPTPDGGFINRSAIQRFVQDPSHPGILYNHDNEYLHYQDDWYLFYAVSLLLLLMSSECMHTYMLPHMTI